MVWCDSRRDLKRAKPMFSLIPRNLQSKGAATAAASTGSESSAMTDDNSGDGASSASAAAASGAPVPAPAMKSNADFRAMLLAKK